VLLAVERSPAQAIPQIRRAGLPDFQPQLFGSVAWIFGADTSGAGVQFGRSTVVVALQTVQIGSE
jgi:hypothetical protein